MKPGSAREKHVILAGILFALVLVVLDQATKLLVQEHIELHGNIRRCHCMICRKSYDLAAVLEEKDIPRCKICRGIIKPDTVLYGERLDKRRIEKAARYIRAADLLIVGGTSLTVNPAYSLVFEYDKKKPLVIINLSLTDLDQKADIVIHEKIGKVFAAL